MEIVEEQSFLRPVDEDTDSYNKVRSIGRIEPD
jgi:hypothetical protein